MESLEQEYKKILEKYNRNILILSQAPKKPIRSFKIKDNLEKPEFRTRLMYAVFLFLFLLFISHQFPFGFLSHWFVETTGTSFTVWNLLIAVFSLILQFIYYDKELNKYKLEKIENDSLLKDYRMKVFEYNNSLRIFNSNHKSVEDLKTENKEYVFKLSQLRDEMKSNESKDNLKVKQTVSLYCPKCGNKFEYEGTTSGKIGGGLSGATAGAILGSKVGIAMGPLGAIAGTIPGAILGGVFGKDLGNNLDKPKCPKCKTVFDIKI